MSRTFAVVELLPALVPDPLELCAELFHLQCLEALDFLPLAQQLLLLTCLALLASLLSRRVFATDE